MGLVPRAMSVCPNVDLSKVPSYHRAEGFEVSIFLKG